MPRSGGARVFPYHERSCSLDCSFRIILILLIVSLLIEDPEKFNEIETKTREAQIPELHDFKQFSDQIRAGQERQLAALIKDSEAAIGNTAAKINS